MQHLVQILVLLMVNALHQKQIHYKITPTPEITVTMARVMHFICYCNGISRK